MTTARELLSLPATAGAPSALMGLDRWATAVYGQDAPCIHTLRRWARDGRIYPLPVKQGRSYFVQPEARYVDPANPSTLMEAVRGTSKARRP
jgi:hypothetical protein